ncbi:protein-methionine-sulfoxide reductase heme-binding subunit MsrQ [Microvirga terrae]|uniref:Protein-methionine-sulfoxide reductase heme-binding subunit MsrQ n=1 Tax=Microvirga terrae TaxID=2740529 RepID=A0ABY5RUI0_9HYPH|nr:MULTISPECIES: protein-methionine-sulfoxide reductase heme-binding subunit MsrQ [Microvirga]MBQ0821870.1 protein-methionine-sulfoxide reductase heme-binding subunit MsrQ [Microvirga sp. HBU67558]UVF20915.1 protein-methionine-sulfoxide reductase heme-binding subunit MsrQ [Microvirga terrae]
MAGRASVQGEKKAFALPQVPKIAVYLVGFIPAVWLFYAGVTDQLGADPMRYLEQGLGLWALRFLIATLAITPLRQLFNVNLLRYRRAVGLLAFYYAALHLLTYLVLDQGLDLPAIVADIVKRPYITIGMATFVILVPLAVTSNNAAIRRMGGQAWAKLHRLVYAAAIGAALHFLLVVKSWPPEPIIYAAIVAVLLGYRLIRSSVKKPSARRRPA